MTDHLGSTIGLTDSSANITQAIAYDSFGNHTVSGNTRYTYTGRERDADTGLMYYRARFYDPQLGRFIGEDPIGLNGGINPYSYVLNNPARSVDPSGLDIYDFALGLVADHYLNDENVVMAGLGVTAHVSAGFGDGITGGFADLAAHQVMPGLPPPSSMGWTPTGAIRNLTPGGKAIDPCSGWYTAGQVGAVVWSLAMAAAGAAEAAAEGGPIAPLVEGEGPPRPVLPEFIGGKTSGVLRTANGDIPLQSGWNGPAQAIPKGTSGFDIVTRTHVEGHAAALMRQQGITDSTLNINNPAICVSCTKLLPRMLPIDSTLVVVLPDGTPVMFLGGH